MFKSYLFVTSLLVVALLGSGCSAKKSGLSDAMPPTPATGAVEDAADAGNDSGTQLRAGVDGKKLGTVFFDYDSYSLKTEVRPVLDVAAALLREDAALRLTIEGHCDDRGSDEYNLALGERRAAAVKSYLVALGIAPERLATVSYGEERPVSIGGGEESWAKNRRSELR